MRLKISYPRVQTEDEDLPTIVHGYPVGSKEEARIAVAADQQGREYAYQKSYFGGRDIRGGQVLDFLFYTKPKPTPLFVQGEYWHGRDSESDLKVAQFAHETSKFYNPPVEVPASEITSVAAARVILDKELGPA